MKRENDDQRLTGSSEIGSTQVGSPMNNNNNNNEDNFYSAHPNNVGYRALYKFHYTKKNNDNNNNSQ
jgi:hypothetical protein